MRAKAIGPETLLLVEEVFASDDVLLKLRSVQAIVSHLANFPSERAEAAAKRARHAAEVLEGLDVQTDPGLDPLVEDELAVQVPAVPERHQEEPALAQHALLGVVELAA